PTHASFNQIVAAVPLITGGQTFTNGTGIAVDPGQNKIYVALGNNGSNNNVGVIDGVTRVFSLVPGTTTNGGFCAASALAINPAPHVLYVLGTITNSVVCYINAATGTPVAGSPTITLPARVAAGNF